MSQRLVAVVGKNNTQAQVTGQNELLVSVGSFAPGIGLATEATALNILSAVDNMRDYEARLVEDSAAPNPVTWLEVRYWDAQSGALGTPEYYLPGSTTPGTPTLPISYINSQSLLTQIYAELQGQSTTLTTIESETANLNTPLSGVATEVTLAIIKGALNTLLTDFNATDFATETTLDALKTTLNSLNAKFVSGTDIGDVTINNAAGAAAVNIQDGGNSITIDAVSLPLPTGAATETTVDAVNTKLTPSVRTHNTVSTTGAGSVPAGSLRGSVINAGSAAGTWNGISLPAGVALPWDAVGPRDTYGVIAYNATGTTFIIEYTT